MTWKPIETAPKWGKLIYVGHPDVGFWPAVWDSELENPFFSSDKGMWRTVDSSFTWSTGINGEDGPDRWADLEEYDAIKHNWDAPL